VTLLLQTWSVCLSDYLSVTIVSSAKTAETMEMPFGLWTRVGQNRSEHCRNPTNTIEPSMCAGDVALYVRLLWPFALICCEHNKCTRNPYRPCPVTQANSASYPEQEPSNEKWQCFLAEPGHLSGKSRAIGQWDQRVSVCLCMSGFRTITFEMNDLWPRYFSRFNLTLCLGQVQRSSTTCSL